MGKAAQAGKAGKVAFVWLDLARTRRSVGIG